VDYSGGFSTCNPQRFGQRFVGKLANPNDIKINSGEWLLLDQFIYILLFHKKRSTRTNPQPKIQVDDVQAKSNLLRPEPLDKTRIEDLIGNLLAASENMLEILPEEDLNLALYNFVEKDEKSAIEE
jgi:double-strand break repair protein MRE11